MEGPAVTRQSRTPLAGELHGDTVGMPIPEGARGLAGRLWDDTPPFASNRTVDVVIACYDVQRMSLIVRAVESVRCQEYSNKLTVVVDYNDELYVRLLGDLPEDVSVIRNARSPGAAGARNTAALVSDCALVAFLDDDACARPGWLRSLVRAMDQPGVVGVGGRILPRWEEECPRWFPLELGWVVGASFTNATANVISVRNVWSGSMMVDRKAFQTVTGFKEDLSKVEGGAQPEDTELCLRLTHVYGDAGQWLMVPSALVEHYIPANRATLRYVINRCWSEGTGKARMRAMAVDRKRALADEKTYLYRTIPRAMGAGVLQSVRLRSPDGLMRSGTILLGVGAAMLGAAATFIGAAFPQHVRAGSI